MDAKVIERLNDLKQQIDEAKGERSELKGALDQHLSRLKNDFGLKDEKAARKELKVIEGDISKLEKSIKSAFSKLEEDFEW